MKQQYAVKEGSNKLKYITGFRGVMCIWIVLFHYTTRYCELFNMSDFMMQFSSGGVMGVFVFFMLSGYFSLYTLDKYYVVGGGKWLINKYIRLYMPFLLAIIVLFSVLRISPLVTRTGSSWFDFLKEIPMLPFLSFKMDGAHWYLQELLIFYVLLFFIAKFKLQHNLFIYYLVIVVNCIDILLSYFQLDNIVTKFIGSLTFHVFNYRIFLGMLLFQIHKNKKFILPFIVMTGLSMLYLPSIYTPLLILSVWILLFYGERLLLIRKILSFKFLVIIGEVSYMWYLIHQNLGYILMNNGLNIIPYELLPYVTLIVTLIIALTLNYILSQVKFNKIL